ncbi:MAG: diguanylate cyclase [Paracoccaceae bacterium]
MQGTILILEGTATNRIMLKVQLSAGYYKVVQSECLDGTDQIIARSRPDLILAGANLPDGGIAEICAMRDAVAPNVPLMIITREHDDAARQAALRAGADDAVSPPVQDLLLLARIRRLIRERNQVEDLRPRDSMHRMLGMSEPATEFERPAQVAIVAQTDQAARALVARFGPGVRHILRCFTLDRLRQSTPSQTRCDAFLIDFSTSARPEDLRLLSELRSRAATRHAAVIALSGAGRASIDVDALDLGADDVIPLDCESEELSLRLDRWLEVRRQSNLMRDTLKRGLRAAVRDPLTGLYNRRFALPHLARAARQAEEIGEPFAVMLVDIDHFKTVNDRFGHPVGDQVIVETARRLVDSLNDTDMVARVGGEEFLIVTSGKSADQAKAQAQCLRERINGRRFDVTSPEQSIPVSVSIGVVAVAPGNQVFPSTTPADADEDAMIAPLIAAADRALYAAKDTGRNRVSMVMSAA